MTTCTTTDARIAPSAGLDAFNCYGGDYLDWTDSQGPVTVADAHRASPAAAVAIPRALAWFEQNRICQFDNGSCR